MAKEGDNTENIPLVDHEGKLRENWRDALDEDIRDEPCLDLITDWQGGVKQFVHAQKSVGKNKVLVPGKDATDDVWNDYFKAAGKPETSADYKYKATQKDYARPEDELAALREWAHKRHFTQAQFAEIMTHLDAAQVRLETEKEEALVRETQETEDHLKKLYGTAYEERIHIANRLINESNEDNDERKAKMIEKFGRDPLFLDWAADVGKNLVEHELLVAKLTQKAPKEAQAELDELQASDDYRAYLTGELGRTNPSKAARIQKQETELYDIIAQPLEEAGSR